MGSVTFVDETTSGERGDAWVLREPRQVNPEEQYRLALASFKRNGFVVLADGRQVEGLDTEVALQADVRVTFLKLVPLVGG